MIDLPLPKAPAWVRLAARLVSRLPAGRYRASHWLGRRVTGPFWMRMPADLGGALFRCDPRDHIARDVCFTGRYEPQETALVRAVLRPGMTFVDVGANWGYFTLLAAHRVSPGGRVVCLEPDPRLFAVLAANVAHNGLSCVQAVQAAAAEAEGTLVLAGYDEESDNWGVSRVTRDAAAAPVHFSVTARPLDQLFDELGLGAVGLLKMDIEGAEGLALAGLARSLAARRVERLLLEVHPAQLAEQGHSAAALVAGLREAGYEGWTVDHSPAATRWASYRREPEAARLLRPFDPAASLDDWPHLLWVAPRVTPLH